MNNTTTSTAAPASAPAANQSGGMLASLAPILLMVLCFYFLIMRPQQKREAKRQALVNSAKRGDRVLTSSGIIGIVHKLVNDKEVSLEIAEGVRIKIVKSAIVDILEKTKNEAATESAEEVTPIIDSKAAKIAKSKAKKSEDSKA